jgi:intracellular septation protein
MTGPPDDADRTDRAEPGSAPSAPDGTAGIAELSAAKPGLGKTVLAEVGPYVVFLIGYLAGGIFWATGLFMLATGLAVSHSVRKSGRLPAFAAVNVSMVAAFGGLTLILGEAAFIQIKPTLSNLLLAAILAGGIPFRYYPMHRAFGHHLELAERTWMRLTVHIALFLAALAAANEFVRLSFSTDVWVMFKVFGLLPLNALFGWTQYLWVRRLLRSAGEGPAGAAP